MHSEWRRLRNNLEMQAKMSSMLTIQFGINLTRICLFKKKWRIFRSILVSIIEVHRRITRMSLRQPQIPVSRGIISECLMQKYPESLGTCLGLILGTYRCLKARSFLRGKSQYTCSLKRQRKGLSKYGVPLRRHDKHHSSSLWVEDFCQ